MSQAQASAVDLACDFELEELERYIVERLDACQGAREARHPLVAQACLEFDRLLTETLRVAADRVG